MGLTLRDARRRLEMSISELARRSGVNRSTLYRLEAGVTPNPGVSTVDSLEVALELPSGSLVIGNVIGRRQGVQAESVHEGSAK